MRKLKQQIWKSFLFSLRYDTFLPYILVNILLFLFVVLLFLTNIINFVIVLFLFFIFSLFLNSLIDAVIVIKSRKKIGFIRAIKIAKKYFHKIACINLIIIVVPLLIGVFTIQLISFISTLLLLFLLFFSFQEIVIEKNCCLDAISNSWKRIRNRFQIVLKFFILIIFIEFLLIFLFSIPFLHYIFIFLLGNKEEIFYVLLSIYMTPVIFLLTILLLIIGTFVSRVFYINMQTKMFLYLKKKSF